MTLRINFKKDPDFTHGYDNSASCTDPNGVTHSIPAKKRGNRHGNLHGTGHSGNGGVVYRLIVKLADVGWAGHPYEAHDGRMVCLTGIIRKKGIPTIYGGEKIKDD